MSFSAAMMRFGVIGVAGGVCVATATVNATALGGTQHDNEWVATAQAAVAAGGVDLAGDGLLAAPAQVALGTVNGVADDMQVMSGEHAVATGSADRHEDVAHRVTGQLESEETRPETDAEAYWTSERMAAAIPATAELSAHEQWPGDDLGVLGAVPAPTVVEQDTSWGAQSSPWAEHRTLSDPVTAQHGGVATESVTMAAKNGKIFFRNVTTGKDYMCSGAAVNSPSKRLVVTAAHCIFDPDSDRLHTNVVFVPKYHHGAEPYGKYTAKRAFLFADYKKYGNTAKGWRSDVAFFSTHTDRGGKTLVQRVGGHGLRTNGSGDFDAYVFGYPTNRQNGEAMVACLQNARKARVSAIAFTSVAGCGFGSGASGGPWLADYNNARGAGYVQSVTSFGPATQTATSPLYGPLFDSRVGALFAQADRQA